MNSERIVGVVLTGGQSRRFGTPKAFASMNGKAFYEWSLAAFNHNIGKTVIVSHPTLTERFNQEVTDKNILLIEDEPAFKGNGPLAGIYSAMKAIEADWYIVLSCDIPLITKETITNIIDNRSTHYQAVVPVSNRRIQPLAALYHRSTFNVLFQQLEKSEYRMTDFLSKLTVNYLTNNMDHLNDFININTQADLKQIETRG